MERDILCFMSRYRQEKDVEIYAKQESFYESQKTFSNISYRTKSKDIRDSSSTVCSRPITIATESDKRPVSILTESVDVKTIRSSKLINSPKRP